MKVTRKQREIKERETLILDTARPMLIRDGYHGLNMDRLAETLEYSKGTIYNHFGCKEEIIIALAIATMEKRTELFERAAAFRGNSRERMMAIGVAADIFVNLFPDHFSVEQMIRTVSIWDKTTEKRRIAMRSCEAKCIGIVAGIVRDAVAHGDLELDADTRPEELVFGLWSMSYGAYSILSASDSLNELGIADPIETLRNNQVKIIDGYGWNPLSSDHDFTPTYERIEQELFHDEIKVVSS